MKISLFLSGSDSTVLCVLLPEGRVMTLKLENQIVVNLHCIVIRHLPKLIITTRDGLVQRYDIETLTLEKSGHCNKNVTMSCVCQNRLGHWLIASVIKHGVISCSFLYR